MSRSISWRCADDRFLVVAVDTDGTIGRPPCGTNPAIDRRPAARQPLRLSFAVAGGASHNRSICGRRHAGGVLARLEAALDEARNGVETGELAAAAG